jgi:hypothetical protein
MGCKAPDILDSYLCGPLFFKQAELLSRGF